RWGRGRSDSPRCGARAPGRMPPDRWLPHRGGPDHAGLPTAGAPRDPHCGAGLERGQARRARAAPGLLRELAPARSRARAPVGRVPVDQYRSVSLSHRAGRDRRGGDSTSGAGRAGPTRAGAVRVLQRGGPGSVSAAPRRLRAARAAAAYGAPSFPVPTAATNRYVAIALARSPACSASLARLRRLSRVVGSRYTTPGSRRTCSANRKNHAAPAPPSATVAPASNTPRRRARLGEVTGASGGIGQPNGGARSRLRHQRHELVVECRTGVASLVVVRVPEKRR